MSSRKEKFEQKRKKMSSNFSGENTVSTQEPTKTPKREPITFDREVKKYTETLLKIEDDEVTFRIGLNAFEQILCDWALENAEEIKAFYSFLVCIPMGIYGWVTYNIMSGLFLGAFTYVLGWVFIGLLGESLIIAICRTFKSRSTPWYKVRIKSDNPIACFCMGALNLFHWLLVSDGIFVTILGSALFGPFILSMIFDGKTLSEAWNYLWTNPATWMVILVVINCMVSFSLFTFSYIWAGIYKGLSYIVVETMNVNYRLAYLYGNKIYKKSF